MKKKAGRPKKGTEQRKTRYLQVRIDAQEKAAFDKAAETAGMDRSVWVRDRLRRVAKAELQKAGVEVPFIPTHGSVDSVK